MTETNLAQLGVTHKLSNGELTRVEVDDDHYYFIDGEFCMSVTEVLQSCTISGRLEGLSSQNLRRGIRRVA